MYVEWFCGGVAAFYALIAWLAVHLRRADPVLAPAQFKSVSVLKPLCGAEPHLYECLKSLCDQSFPHFQIVFGVSEPSDPAIAVVNRLREEFPSIEMRLSVDARKRGTNRKVSNLRNMLPLADYQYLIVADSDIVVPRDYLQRVTAHLNDPRVGIVTCAYAGQPEANLWSRLGALFINDWFIPSARVAALFGSRAFSFGATIALRRDTLNSIGGFAAIADQLADDYRLGQLTRDLGLRTVLSDCVVQTRVSEPTLSSLVRHQLRWLRTIRAVRPAGYTMAFVSFSVPVACACAVLTDFSAISLGLLGLSSSARIFLHREVHRTAKTSFSLFLTLGSDFLTAVLWGWALFTQHVEWRDVRYKITRDGAVEQDR